jgi:lipoyl-dependent peroxiredoxin
MELFMNKVEKILYKAEVTATGGRDGKVISKDGSVDFKLALQKELGGPGGPGLNPELLFASGYSACFLSAIKFLALKEKVQIPTDASVTAIVGIGPLASEGFGLTVELQVALPEVDPNIARKLVETAHDHVCPYSNATRGNIDVKLTFL